MAIMKKPYTDVVEVEKYFEALYGEVTDFQKDRYLKAFNNFKNVFGYDGAYVASSSGRVEVCGNHTDHNGGKVLSCAISLDTLAMFMPTDNGIIKIKSEGYSDIEIDLNGAENEKIGTSAALVRGVAVATKNKGFKVGGFNATFTSNVIGGAGISSSASFEVLVAEILNFLYNDGKMTAEEKAVIAQYSENVYFGKPCGLLDQTAIAFGGLKKLDFKDKNKIGVTEINNPLSDYTLVLINTGGSHADLTDEYAAIPSEMFSVAKAMGKERLVEIDENLFYNELPNILDKVSDRAVLRAVHFYDENNRVDVACKALCENNFTAFLNAVKESGISSLCKLQNCYVSGGKEQAIPKALSISAKYLNGGVNRVHGGGFAGSILNIVKNDCVSDFVDTMSKFFEKKNVIPLKVRTVGTMVL
ncbi:MAG: galactokinase [Clostridia bacterium]|nr:galactokinase [Clostridia bacterium]